MPFRRFLKLVHGSTCLPFLNFAFEISDFVQATGGAAICKPARASARASMPFHITSLNRPFDGDDRYPFVCSVAAGLCRCPPRPRVALQQPAYGGPAGDRASAGRRDSLERVRQAPARAGLSASLSTAFGVMAFDSAREPGRSCVCPATQLKREWSLWLEFGWSPGNLRDFQRDNSSRRF
jgi:hypothetical protein